MYMGEQDRLQKVIDWVRKGTNRSAQINIGNISDPESINIWIYDYSLMDGCHIKLNDIDNIDKIDLKKCVEESEKEQYEFLKTKFEGSKAIEDKEA